MFGEIKMNKVKEVLKNIKPDNYGNYFYCRYGLQQVLGMLYDAADGITKEELKSWKVDNISKNKKNDISDKTVSVKETKAKSSGIPFLMGISLAGARKSVIIERRLIKGNGGLDSIWEEKVIDTTNLETLLSGNLLILNKNKGVQINPEYDNKLKEKYDAKCLFYDKNNLKYIVKEANDFVEKHTGGHIKNAVDEGTLKVNGVAVTNSVYFFSKWLKKLESAGNILFSLNNDNEKAVAAMKGKCEKYIYNESVHGFSYDYLDTRYSFIALMLKNEDRKFEWNEVPDFDGLDLDDINKTAADDNAKTVGLNIVKMDVYFTMPKFKIDTEVKLDTAVKEMGVKSIYEPNAVLSQGFSANDVLYLNTINQKCGIKVDENGTEAHSVTMVMTAAGCMIKKEKIELVFDKPYFFMIYDKVDKQPVFVGIINNPQWKE